MVEHLTGRGWIRSQEEETGPVRVYRPEGHDFPPARGREELLFHEDGRLDYVHPGRGDRPSAVTGSWRTVPGEDDRLLAHLAGQAIELDITEAAPDLLRLRWLPT
ncbi:hypothetical protein ACI797_11715 [Geodermatophilus sp. SYSU D00691]